MNVKRIFSATAPVLAIVAAGTALAESGGQGKTPKRAPSADSGQIQGDAVAGPQYAPFAVSRIGVTLRAVTDFLILFPDGSALGSLPDSGMDGFNPQAWLQDLARKGPINNAVARYQMFPDHVELAFSNFSRSYALPGASTTNGVLVSLCHCDGSRFSGVYAWGQFALQFSPDGAFVDRGAIDAVAGMDPGHPKLGQGQYIIQNNTLYLTYTDGRRFRTSFAAPAEQEGGPSFDWIAIRQKLSRRVQ